MSRKYTRPFFNEQTPTKSIQKKGFGDVVTYVAFLFHPVLSSIFSIAIVILEVATPR